MCIYVHVYSCVRVCVRTRVCAGVDPGYQTQTALPSNITKKKDPGSKDISTNESIIFKHLLKSHHSKPSIHAGVQPNLQAHVPVCAVMAAPPLSHSHPTRSPTDYSCMLCNSPMLSKGQQRKHLISDIEVSHTPAHTQKAVQRGIGWKIPKCEMSDSAVTTFKFDSEYEGAIWFENYCTDTNQSYTRSHTTAAGETWYHCRRSVSLSPHTRIYSPNSCRFAQMLQLLQLEKNLMTCFNNDQICAYPKDL